MKRRDSVALPPHPANTAMNDTQHPPHDNPDTHDHPDAHAGHDAHEGLAHPMPLKILAGVLIALLVLTWLTVAATWIDLGRFNVWLALLIAVVKGALVVLYFMHLRYDSPFNAVVLVTALLFVVIFIAVTITDSSNYQDMYEQPTILQDGP